MAAATALLAAGAAGGLSFGAGATAATALTVGAGVYGAAKQGEAVDAQNAQLHTEKLALKKEKGIALNKRKKSIDAMRRQVDDTGNYSTSKSGANINKTNSLTGSELG